MHFIIYYSVLSAAELHVSRKQSSGDPPLDKVINSLATQYCGGL